MAEPNISIVIPHEELEVEDNDIDYSGWFCIETDPWPCPRCSFIANYVTALHFIIVWPESDHPSMLDVAARCKVAGRNPKITEYRPDFGMAVSWYNWEAHGRPAHTQP